MSRILTAILPASLVAINLLCAGDELKSGPAAGKYVPGAFHPLVVHCPSWPYQVGKKHSFVDQYDDGYYVLMFARHMSDATTDLLKKIDALLAHKKARDVQCCVVLLSDDKDKADTLTTFAKKHALKHVDLAVDSSVGPKAFHIAKEAGLTVSLIADRKVAATHAYRHGQLNENAVKRLIHEIDNTLTGGEQIKSGPQPGATVPGPFHPIIVHFPKDPIFVGKRMEFVEEGFGPRAVVLIFARALSEPQTYLFEKIDAKLAQNRDMRGLVVWLSSHDDGLPEKLKDLGRMQKLNHLVLTIHDVAGPKAYNVAKEAELTIVLYDKRKVLANHAYRSDEFKYWSVQRVINDIDDKLVRRSP